MQISDLLNLTPSVFMNNVEYLNVLELRNTLMKISNRELFIKEDKIIVPFYISGQKIFELYDFELRISCDQTTFKEYVERRTGKLIKNIDKETLSKNKHCYISSNLKEKNNIYYDFLKYIEYLLNSKEIELRVKKVGFNDFIMNNLYFEIY